MDQMNRMPVRRVAFGTRSPKKAIAKRTQAALCCCDCRCGRCALVCSGRCVLRCSCSGCLRGGAAGDACLSIACVHETLAKRAVCEAVLL